MAALLARAFAFVLLVLDRTGAAARLASSPLFPHGMALASRAAWALALAATAILLLYAALSAGPDRRVRAFRVFGLLAACVLPLLAARLIPAGFARPFGGGVLAGTFAAALAHRALARRRKESVASRLLGGFRFLLELAGIALCLVAAIDFLRNGPELGPVAIGGLLCLRLSIADLLDPSRLSRETGLTASAVRNLDTARRRRRAGLVRRGAHLAFGLLKLGLAALWVFLPLLAAVAPGEVARGEWPRGVLVLALYPAVALFLTALLLLAGALGELVSSPIEAARGAIVGAGTLLWLWLVFGRTGTGAAIAALPGLYAAETLLGFLFGAAARGR